jgi:diacylglycerol O-acyltransferase/trehalose O-mycolyltransferase
MSVRKMAGALAALAIFGAIAGTASAQADPNSPECVARTTPVPDAPLTLVKDTVVAGYDGRLHDLLVNAPAVHEQINVDVLLPPTYATRRHTRYHVLYLLHGSGGSYTDWIDNGAATIIGNAYKTAHLPQVIAVMPFGGLEGFYTDWYGTDVDQPSEGAAPGWATFVSDELVHYIDAHYRTIATRSGRAIAGLSMGGFGATSLPAQHPDEYSVAGSFSGADDTDWDYPYENEILYDTNPAFTGGLPDNCIFGDPFTEQIHWEAVDPTYLAANLKPVALWLASGNGLPGPYDTVGPAEAAAGAVELDIWDMNQGFVAALNQAGVAHTDFFYGPGTHSWPYWDRDLTDFLPFLTKQWAAPTATPKTFNFRSEATRFSVWGWSFSTNRSVAEFTYLSNVNRSGLSATGSGTLTVTTAPLYKKRSKWIVAAAGHRTRVVASRSGQLTFKVGLGPSHTTQQSSFPADGGPPSGWTTSAVRITRA